MPEKFEFTPKQLSLIEQLKKLIEQGRGYNDDFVSPETYRKIFDQLGDLKNKKIVDLGAGMVPIGTPNATNYLRALEEKKVTLIPVDASFDVVKTWNIQEMDTGRISPLHADAFRLPLADESVDGAMSINLINVHWNAVGEDNHLAAQELLKEMARITKKGGFGIINTFGYYQETHDDGSITYNNDIPADQVLTVSEIRQAASATGFTEVVDIPIDDRRLNKSRKELNTKRREGVSRVDIVEPGAFLLRK